MSPILWLKISLFLLGLAIVLGLVFKIYNVGRLTERARQMEVSLREAQRARQIRNDASRNPDAFLVPRRATNH